MKYPLASLISMPTTVNNLHLKQLEIWQNQAKPVTHIIQTHVKRILSGSYIIICLDFLKVTVEIYINYNQTN